MRTTKSRCDHCGGDRWIEHEPERWAPCPACNHDLWQRWATGTYDHPRGPE